jgi:hypothetical protein
LLFIHLLLKRNKIINELHELLSISRLGPAQIPERSVVPANSSLYRDTTAAVLMRLDASMFAASLVVALYAVDTKAALRQFNFTIHSASNAPGM